MKQDLDAQYREVRELDRQLFSIFLKLGIVFSCIACMFSEVEFAITTITVTLFIVITLYTLTEIARRI